MKKIYYSWKDIQGAVLEIARQMYADNFRPDYIVGITRGGAVPAVMLSQYLGVPMKPLQVSLRDGGECVSDCGMAEDAFGSALPELDVENDLASVLEGASELLEMGLGMDWKNILIIDDINDTGATFNWIKKDWQSSCLPSDGRWEHVWHNNVKFAAITHNQSSEFKDTDYYAYEVNKAEEDCWLVYPWEEFWK